MPLLFEGSGHRGMWANRRRERRGMGQDRTNGLEQRDETRQMTRRAFVKASLIVVGADELRYDSRNDVDGRDDRRTMGLGDTRQDLLGKFVWVPDKDRSTKARTTALALGMVRRKEECSDVLRREVVER